MKDVKSVISVNTSQIKEVEWNGRVVKTGIFKKPVKGVVSVKGVSINGDEQADLQAHGGVDKAIYAYPEEHYAYWKDKFPKKDFEYGMFGENLTTKGLFEKEVCVGDTFKIGTTELIAVQPRIPCFKLGIRFGTQRIVKMFYQTDFSGIYLKIHKEGEFQAGDTIELIKKEENSISIKDLLDIIKVEGDVDTEILQKLVKLDHLSKSMKDWLKKQFPDRF